MSTYDTVPAPAPSAAGCRSVLIVDDDVALARAFQRTLTRGGFEVVVAESGTTAVETIVSTPFDVIVTDIQMPGMTGVDLLRIVRAQDLDVPVILMTGAPTVETAIEAVSLGALQYLAKPFESEVLIEVVERASRLHRMAEMKRDAFRLSGIGHGLAGDRAGLQTRFESALASMWIAFQPIVSAKDGRVYGYEALMRTNEPSFRDPASILSAAERLDRLPELGRHVRALAGKAFEQAPAGTLLFVNLHTRDLLDPELYEMSSPLSRFADRVVLEITERATIDDVKDVRARVSSLRGQGYRIAIDDLGAGYAGLSSFAALEPDIVKLDMSLVHNVHQSDVRGRLIASMTALCKEMGMLVVAEGVEVAEERTEVVRFGCDLLQGYLLARPGPPFPAVAEIA
jgi:EAL domain-containing protein (putative c-di-GMP-specific phosphodiesterase class I)